MGSSKINELLHPEHARLIVSRYVSSHNGYKRTTERWIRRCLTCGDMQRMIKPARICSGCNVRNAKVGKHGQLFPR